ncbi:peroxidase-like [Amyelois transitella]|uniref:peroxidase-like n=1 Tax=Amyelois transitella TaxID=680683 RepID=UPI00298F4457|nr:peroxidase-like [Amyelois transitella]
MLLLVFISIFSVCYGIFYDSYLGTEIGIEEIKRYNKINATFWCTNDIEPCNTNEWKRIDGSCNNINHPSIGAANTPQVRLLPAVYDKDFEQKTTKSGSPMPLSRYLRTRLLSEGRVPDQVLTQLTTHFLVFVVSDVLSVHDTVNYIIWKQHCCTEKGETDRECTPNRIPDDDPVFRFSNIRCLNMTRPISFQSVGCTEKDTVPERVVTTTPIFDLSQVYGHNIDNLNRKGRLYQNGLLKYEYENGRIWPPSSRNSNHLCSLNQRPAETRCHDTPEQGPNSILGINLFTIWTWRHHNKVANELATLNPCWSDENLFYTARDINIAVVMQILFYEMLPILMGRENLLRDSVISPSRGFRDLYNPNVLPKMSLEFPFMWRYIHTMQEGAIKMYDNKGRYLKQVPLVNLTLRTGFLGVDNNLDFITQGSFRQASGKVDYTVDYDVTGIGLGPFQRANDILTSDLAKNRLFGFQPYVKYKEYCSGKSYKSFEDLLEFIDAENVDILKDVYEDVDDIDLMVGVWLEKLVPGGRVPTTFYCIIVEQLVRTVVSDRHWYERTNRPHAFDADQLHEIRKASMARLLCDVGDSVTEIQPKPFMRIRPGNQLKQCKDIPFIDIEAWRDLSCSMKSS